MRPDKVWLFGDLLEKNKRVFKMPVYQRKYDAYMNLKKSLIANSKEEI